MDKLSQWILLQEGLIEAKSTIEQERYLREQLSFDDRFQFSSKKTRQTVGRWQIETKQTERLKVNETKLRSLWLSLSESQKKLFTWKYSISRKNYNRIPDIPAGLKGCIEIVQSLPTMTLIGIDGDPYNGKKGE